MATQEYIFETGTSQLSPYNPLPHAVTAAVGFGANLTVRQGQAVGQKTSDLKCYPLNPSASDGTQLFKGFNIAALATDANGLVYLVNNGTGAGPNYYSIGASTGDLYVTGAFNPNDLITSPVGTSPVAEVDTITVTSPTTNDIFNIFTATGDVVSVTVGATQTPTAVVTLQKAAWAANPATNALAVATGTATLILTAVTPGQKLNLTVGGVAANTGTIAKVTTPAVAGSSTEVDTFTLTTAPTAGDLFTFTQTQPNAVVTTAVATSTASIATTTPLIAAAWNAVPELALIATATSTATTVVLTATNVGIAIGAVLTTNSLSTTIGKVVTTPAAGINFADIVSGAPGARILPSGIWEVP